MKYILTLTLVILTQSINGQIKYVANGTYDESGPAYVPRNTQSTINLLNSLEKDYLENRAACNEIEIYILTKLQKLKVDTLNVAYRIELKKILENVKNIHSSGRYEYKTLDILEIIENLGKNEINYQDEEIIIRKELERKLKIQEEENKMLKSELELKKVEKVKSEQKSIKKR